MNKFRKLIALITAALLCLSLVACGAAKEEEAKGPKGTYTAMEGLAELTFDGEKVEYKSFGADEASTGTFTMDENNITVEFSNGNTDSFVYDETEDTLDWSGEGVIIFTKAE